MFKGNTHWLIKGSGKLVLNSSYTGPNKPRRCVCTQKPPLATLMSLGRHSQISQLYGKHIFLGLESSILYFSTITWQFIVIAYSGWCHYICRTYICIYFIWWSVRYKLNNTQDMNTNIINMVYLWLWKHKVSRV